MQAIHRGRGANGTIPCDHMPCFNSLTFCIGGSYQFCEFAHQPTTFLEGRKHHSVRPCTGHITVVNMLKVVFRRPSSTRLIAVVGILIVGYEPHIHE